MSDDLLRYNRHSLAGALRRLSEEAAVAAATVVADDALPGEEQAAIDGVMGRIESVRHARTLLNATRAGARAAATNRRSA